MIPKPHAFVRDALVVAIFALPLGGCALIQPPPVPRFRWFGRSGSGTPDCSAHVAAAHMALAAAGAASGDPAAVASAHADAAAAVAANQACLAQ